MGGGGGGRGGEGAAGVGGILVEMKQPSKAMLACFEAG